MTGQIDSVIIAETGFGYNSTDTIEAGNADLEPVILGGRVVGVIPEFFRKKNKSIEYTDADELIVVKDMRNRKAIMDQRSDAFIVLPGGVGTLEEAMEILSMKQLCLSGKPLAFINTNNFYDGFISNLQKMVDLKFAQASTLDLFTVCPDPVSAVDFVLTNYSKKL